MSEQQPHHIPGLIVRPDQPLIAVPVATNGHEQVIYFTDEEEADRALGQRGSRAPIKLAGVWSDLDADMVLTELEQLRHRSSPTPPITSL